MNLYELENACYGGVEIDYDMYWDCEGYGCEEEGICRCSTMDNVTIESVNIRGIVDSIVYRNDFSDYYSSVNYGKYQILVYGIDRILRHHKIYNTDLWDYEIGGSYYGDEIVSVHLEKSLYNSIVKDIENIESMRDNRIVETVLKMEYGDLIKSAQKKEWKVKLIDRDRLIIGNSKHMDIASKKDLDFYRNMALPRGIAVKYGKNYRLVDGYHRVSSTKDGKILMIVGEPK